MADNFNKRSQGLILEKVHIDLNGRNLLRLDHSIAPGEVLTVMGESGSGKSTLLDFVAGFLSPAFSASGRVVLDGVDITRVPPQARQVGLMFQSPLLFPNLSVLDNLLFALPAEIKGRARRRSTAEASLADVGLKGFANRDPATLSGGQQTRVALLRLLLAAPKALLLDEPFSSLDRALRADIRSQVLAMARDRGLPVLLVTHDHEDAEAAGGPVVQLGRDRSDL